MLSSSWNYSGCPCAKWKHETGQGMLVSTPTSVDVSTTHTDVVGVTPTLSGRHLAQLVEHASHVRLCSKPGFNSRPGSLCCVSFPLSLSLFPVISSAVLTIKPKIYILKKKLPHYCSVDHVCSLLSKNIFKRHPFNIQWSLFDVPNWSASNILTGFNVQWPCFAIEPLKMMSQPMKAGWRKHGYKASNPVKISLGHHLWTSKRWSRWKVHQVESVTHAGDWHHFSCPYLANCSFKYRRGAFPSSVLKKTKQKKKTFYFFSGSSTISAILR